MPYLTACLALVIVFKDSISILILSKAKLVKFGLAGGIAFNLILIPFWWSGWSLINLLLVLVQLLLLKEEYEYSIIAFLKRE